MEYEVWTRSGCQEHLWVGQSLLPSLTRPAEETHLPEPEHFSQPRDAMQSPDNDATICIVVYIDFCMTVSYTAPRGYCCATAGRRIH